MREHINPAHAILAEHPDARCFPRLIEAHGFSDCALLQALGYRFPRAAMRLTPEGRVEVLSVSEPHG